MHIYIYIHIYTFICLLRKTVTFDFDFLDRACSASPRSRPTRQVSIYLSCTIYMCPVWRIRQSGTETEMYSMFLFGFHLMLHTSMIDSLLASHSSPPRTQRTRQVSPGNTFSSQVASTHLNPQPSTPTTTP